MQDKVKVFAIIVAYNPDINKLHRLVRFLKSQISFIVIANNSDHDLSIEGDNVKIFNFNKNLGVAVAQNTGMKWAFENGSDFVWLLDQDSYPDPESINTLLSSYSKLSLKGYNIGLIAMRDYDKDSGIRSKAILNKGRKIGSSNCFIESAILSSGSLIPKKAYEKIGGMEDRLFIDYVDFEYCWRLQNNGFLTVRNNDALLAHRLGQGDKKVFGIIKINIPAAFRHYYQFRNVLLLIKRNYVPLYWKVSYFFKLIFHIFIYRLMFHDGKERLTYMMQGIKDAVFNKYERIEPNMGKG